VGLGLAAGGQASAGGPRVAQGRVVFPVGAGAGTGTESSGGASQVVALPSGGAVLVGGGGRGQRGFYAAELTASGSLDASFGRGGIVRVGVDSPPSRPLEVLRQVDGKLVVVVSGRETTAFSFGQLLVVRLDADGSLDRTFGSQGIATTPLAPACDSCRPAGLAPDGDIFLTGEAGQLSAALGGDPSAAGVWNVVALTRSGGLDQAFGQGGQETIGATDAGGYDLSVLPSGEVMTLGMDNIQSPVSSTAILTLLGPDGGADRRFNGGVPVGLPAGVPAGAMLVRPDGSVVVGGGTGLFDYTASGHADAGFGDGGVAHVGALPEGLELLTGAGGGLLAVGRVAGAPGTVGGLRVSASGRAESSSGGPAQIRFRPHFGGGGSGATGGGSSRVVRGLVQDSFVERAVAARADGSYLAVGGVGVVEGSANGRVRGRSVFEFAAASITPGFTEDAGFGGRPARVGLKLSVPAQSAAGALAARAIRVRLDFSAVGLARVRIKAGGHVIAQGVVGIFGRGPQILGIGLSGYGAHVLAGRRPVVVRATGTGRDLVTAGASVSAPGRLD
jgi:uncharacterized delta-60 repeat protein